MKLTLEQTNIEAAVQTYLQTTYGLSLRNKQTTMEFKAGRGTNGVSVLVSIDDVTIPGEVAQVNVSQGPLAGYATAPKVSAADKIAASVSTSPEGTLGAAIAAGQTAAETPVPVADLPSTTPAETPVVTAGEVPPQENGTADPFASAGANTVSDADPVVESQIPETEVPAVTTESVVVTDEAPVVEAAPTPVKTTSGLFS